MYTFDPTLYFITDSTGLSEEEFLYRVECALDGGATLMQLREKERTTREYIHLADKVHSIARRYNVPLIIDDRVDVALATDAEGVHVGQTDMPVSIARKLMGPDRIVGATTKTVPQPWRRMNRELIIWELEPSTQPPPRSRQCSHPRIH
mgnify:CR=1 FL=1